MPDHRAGDHKIQFWADRAGFIRLQEVTAGLGCTTIAQCLRTLVQLGHLLLELKRSNPGAEIQLAITTAEGSLVKVPLKSLLDVDNNNSPATV